MSQRIQLSRKKGWRKPDGAVVVARPSKWGNPYRADKHGKRVAVELFKQFLESRPDLREMIRNELAGKDLCCWCKLGDACHADVLLSIANL